MKTFLITGSSGFVGSNLVRALIQKKVDCHLLVNDKSNLWRIKDILYYVHLHKVDITDNKKIKSIIKKIEPDCTFHLASYGVYPTQNDFNSMLQTNVYGTFNLLESLQKYCESSKIINIGSSFEYGNKVKSIKNQFTFKPNTLYGISKYTQSLLANYFSQKTSLTITTLRIFGVFGRYESEGRLIPDILLSIIKGKKLFISSPKSKRDFIHINDVVDCIISASKKNLNNEILDVGNGKEYSVKEIINISSKILNRKIPIFYNKKNLRDFDKDAYNYHADISKTKKLLDWRPKITINDGLLDTYSWFKENISFYN